MSKRIVIALGGNALGNTAAEQLSLVNNTLYIYFSDYFLFHIFSINCSGSS